MILLQVNTNSDIFYADLIKVITYWRDNVGIDSGMTNAGVNLGIGLCGLFALIWTASKLYPVIAGDEKLSVLPILRPFAICLILFNWYAFIDICRFPGQKIEKAFQEEFETKWLELKGKSAERYDLLDKIAYRLMDVGNEVERAEQADRSFEMQSSDVSKSSGWSISSLGAKISGMAMFVMNKLKRLMISIIEYLCLLFMNVVVCGVFFMQAACLIVLIVLGPIAFAFSCLDPWRSSWTKWFARFFSVTLWSGLAWLVCWIGSSIILEVIQAEITTLNYQLSLDKYALAALSTLAGQDTVLFPLLFLFVAFGMFIIFPVSTWIIETSGGHQVISAPAGAAAATAGAIMGIASMAGGGKK